MSDSDEPAMEEGEEEEEVYCICRSSDSDRFMIACDKCEEWYHGDCIDVTEREANHIKRFYCDRCREKDPDLKIRYKESHKSRRPGEEKSKERSEKVEKGDKHARAPDKAERKEKAVKVEKVEKAEKAEKSEKPEKHDKHDKHDKKSRDEKDLKREQKEAKKAARAEKERARAEKERVRAEKERARAEKEKEKERARAAKEREAERDREAAAAAAAAEQQQQQLQQQQQRPRPPRGCGLCVGCLRETDCGGCSSCRGPPHRPCKRRSCVGAPPQPQPSPLREPNRPASPPPREPTPPPPPPPRRKSADVRRAPTAGRRRKRAELSDDEGEMVEPSGKQCYGPQCAKPGRPGSRYCSDQCGLNLARNRIFQVLPQRIQEWNMTRCVAEDRNMRTLERIRREQLDSQTHLERLTRAHQELDRVCERGRRGTIDPAAMEDDVEEEPHSIHCVTCGHEVATRNAIRHMEKCFGKYESQTSFGSLYQTRVEGFNMFCDFYNPAQRTYCKRLRVLCPEHCKNPKVADDEVCGCPLVADVFTNMGQFCRAPKKKCLKHFSWEKLRRAELDMERVRWAMKMDELLEQERQCRQSMANRAGVLALMLHSTYDHDVMEKVQSQQKKMANKVKVKVS